VGAAFFAYNYDNFNYSIGLAYVESVTILSKVFGWHLFEDVLRHIAAQCTITSRGNCPVLFSSHTQGKNIASTLSRIYIKANQNH
jgi:hypothetical protein